MLGWNKNKTAILLIFSSLLMLGAFLAYWLHNVYRAEKQNLEKELNYAVNEIINELEDSLIQRVFTQNITIDFKNAEAHELPLGGETKLRINSLKVTNIVDDESDVAVHPDSNIHISIKKESDINFLPKGSSLLPFLWNWHQDSLQLMMTNEDQINEVVSEITTRFDAFIADTNFPKNYEYIELSNNAKSEGMLIDMISEPLLDVTHEIKILNYQWYLLQEIRHQILFCLFLFGAICISFYMIYFNWRKQQKLIEIKNDFISNVTHELKTPISTVSVALEALSGFDVLKDKEKTADYLNISRQELNRLKILVDKVLKMSIFEKGTSKLNVEKIDLEKLLDDVLGSMKIQFEKVQAKVTKDLKGGDFIIDGDKIHLTNVIYNLLDNAIKYGGAAPEIRVQLSESNGMVDLYVIDKGIGIPEDEQAKVFHRFYRVSTGDTHDVKGHGLGLSYVSSIIEQHKGKIELESKPKEGSSFHISLKKNYVEN